MNWNDEIIQKLEWNGPISNLEQKEKVAKIVVEKVKDGDCIGFGSGSTSYLATKAIAERVQKENLHITAIPTSHEIRMLCDYFKIPTATLIDQKPDWAFDGADEVNSHNWLIKGRGAAMFKEKLNIINASITYILVDESKFVEKLGQKFPIPIECYPYAIYSVKERLIEMGATSATLRLAKCKDGPVITENGNIILDTVFDTITEDMEKELKSIVGVIETGLFINHKIEILK